MPPLIPSLPLTSQPVAPTNAPNNVECLQPSKTSTLLGKRSHAVMSGTSATNTRLYALNKTNNFTHASSPDITDTRH